MSCVRIIDRFRGRISKVSIYPLKVNHRLKDVKNAGDVPGANTIAKNATFVCGAVLQFSLRINVVNKVINEAKFKTNGCGFLIAAADVLAEKITGKFLTELHSLDAAFIQSEITPELGVFPKNRRHCMELALESLQSAFAEFRALQIAEWSGEKALICSCFSVSEETIEKAIIEQSLDTIEEVAAVCNAGSGCGSCQPLIQEIIDSVKYDF